MEQRELTVINPSGLHLRPAAILAKEASKCSSSVSIIYDNKRINCKSSLSIISACIKKGSNIIVECDGENEQKDIGTIATLIQSGLGEF